MKIKSFKLLDKKISTKFSKLTLVYKFIVFEICFHRKFPSNLLTKIDLVRLKLGKKKRNISIMIENIVLMK